MADADVNVVLARYAERAERYDEMKDFMAARVQSGTALNYEERDMFSAAFKSALSGRRAAVRVAMAMAQEGPPEEAHHARGYRTKVEAELTDICQRCISLIDSILLQNPGSDEAKIFYLKMAGDYWRYMAEFAEDMKKREHGSQANAYYTQGFNDAVVLPTTHPTRLGLALNFSVFLHEVEGQTEQAIEKASSALHAALGDQERLQTETTKEESMLTMQLLQDNLQLWSPQC